MLRFIISIVFIAVWLAAAPARAGIVVTVDKTAQVLTVNVDGMTRYQ